MSRLLFLDENLPKRLATELRYRGRQAVTSAAAGLLGLDDPALLTAIVAGFPGAVLVTADDHLPADHGAAIRHSGIVIATIDPNGRPAGVTLDQWRRDVVHRWAHRMQDQVDQSIRRYGVVPREWTSPRRAGATGRSR